MFSVTKCRDLPPRTRFRYHDRVYLKLEMNLARDEFGVQAVFASDADTQRLGRATAGSASKPPPQPKQN